MNGLPISINPNIDKHHPITYLMSSLWQLVRFVDSHLRKKSDWVVGRRNMSDRMDEFLI